MINCCSIELSENLITIGFFFRNTGALELKIKITVAIRVFTT